MGDRVRSALDEIGVSVFAGMVTSASAAVALMICQLQFFYKFGVFLMLTVSISWIWANVAFMASMSLCGPVNNAPSWSDLGASIVARIQSWKKDKAEQRKSNAVVEHV